MRHMYTRRAPPSPPQPDGASKAPYAIGTERGPTPGPDEFADLGWLSDSQYHCCQAPKTPAAVRWSCERRTLALRMRQQATPRSDRLGRGPWSGGNESVVVMLNVGAAGGYEAISSFVALSTSLVLLPSLSVS